MKAVIMAGGEGSRLRSISGDLPKPMVAVCGKPILQYQIENLRENGIRDIILVIGHLGQAIRDYFGDGSAFDVRIRYYFEDHPMGTAGALYELREALSEDFLLLMGDLMLDVDFQRFAAFHKGCGGLVTLFVHPNAHPYDSDIIETDTEEALSDYDEAHCGETVFLNHLQKNSHAEAQSREAQDMGNHPSQSGEADGYAHARVTGVLGKKDARPAYYHNQVNAGIYALSPKALLRIRKPKSREQIEAELSEARRENPALTGAEEKKILKSGKIDLDRDVIRPLIAEGQVYACRSTEYVKDMGTPDRYEAVRHDLENGTVASRNLKNPQKCIFLDRDGTINQLNGFVSSPEELKLIPGAAEAIARINRSEYLCIVITNQPVVARGECSLSGLDCIHAKLETELGKSGAYIDGLYFCPHHPDQGFAGEVPELKFRCGCRKPKPGMLLKAAQVYHIDLKKSWFIGDSMQDIACGNAAGTRTALISAEARGTGTEPTGGKSLKAGGGAEDAPAADILCGSLADAVSKIFDTAD